MSGETRQGLRVLVAVWYLAGAILVIDLLVKGDVDGLAARTGGSAVAVVLLGFAVAAGARLAARSGYAGLFGALTALITTATFFLLAVEIWAKHPLHQSTRTVTMLVISLLLGSVSLLLDSARDEDEGVVQLARGVAIFGLVALGALTVLSACGTDVSPRLAGLAAAIFLIPAVSLPALRALAD
jgi:small-conductance mechanosensitive channel